MEEPLEGRVSVLIGVHPGGGVQGVALMTPLRAGEPAL